MLTDVPDGNCSRVAPTFIRMDDNNATSPTDLIKKKYLHRNAKLLRTLEQVRLDKMILSYLLANKNIKNGIVIQLL